MTADTIRRLMARVPAPGEERAEYRRTRVALWTLRLLMAWRAW
jgi:hypothetical protein